MTTTPTENLSLSKPVSETFQKLRRNWTPAQKLKILNEIDQLQEQGESTGAYLRRNGIYSSGITAWGKLRKDGILAASNGKRGPVARQTEKDKEIEALQRDNAKLRKELDISKKIIDLQKKIAHLLDVEEK